MRTSPCRDDSRLSPSIGIAHLGQWANTRPPSEPGADGGEPGFRTEARRGYRAAEPGWAMGRGHVRSEERPAIRGNTPRPAVQNGLRCLQRGPKGPDRGAKKQPSVGGAGTYEGRKCEGNPPHVIHYAARAPNAQSLFRGKWKRIFSLPVFAGHAPTRRGAVPCSPAAPRLQ